MMEAEEETLDPEGEGGEAAADADLAHLHLTAYLIKPDYTMEEEEEDATRIRDRVPFYRFVGEAVRRGRARASRHDDNQDSTAPLEDLNFSGEDESSERTAANPYCAPSVAQHLEVRLIYWMDT